MIDLTDEATIRFLHSGCALLVCTIGADAQPRASRAWGLTVDDPAAGRVRVLLEADDHITLANARAGGRIAVTGTSVAKFTSMQLKGRAVLVEPATAADEAKRVQYTHDFLADIHETDGYPIDVMERWARANVVACVVELDSSFDQTPGPSAGAAIGRAAP